MLLVRGVVYSQVDKQEVIKITIKLVLELFFDNMSLLVFLILLGFSVSVACSSNNLNDVEIFGSTTSSYNLTRGSGGNSDLIKGYLYSCFPVLYLYEFDVCIDKVTILSEGSVQIDFVLNFSLTDSIDPSNVANYVSSEINKCLRSHEAGINESMMSVNNFAYSLAVTENSVHREKNDKISF